MLSKVVLSFAIIALGTAVLPQVIFAQTEAKQVEKAARVKRDIQKLGTGQSAVVKIKLYDKTVYKGYVSRSGDEDFDIVDSAQTLHIVKYADVKSIGGKNLSTGAKIGIGVGIGAGVTVLVLFLILSHLD